MKVRLGTQEDLDRLEDDPFAVEFGDGLLIDHTVRR